MFKHESQHTSEGGAIGTVQPRRLASDLKWVGLVFVAALLMGVPTLRGGFVGGDDHRLVLNHVLVNRPSLDHAVELFAITHRDLYQPLPLLTFSLEFVLVEWLGLAQRGPEGFAWLFHLSNVLLHGLNTVLVWFVVRMLHGGMMGRRERGKAGWGAIGDVRTFDWRSPRGVASVAALLFAIHPLQTEVVAWTNGRMILLSTFFLLLSLLCLHGWLGGSTLARGAGSRVLSRSDDGELESGRKDAAVGDLTDRLQFVLLGLAVVLFCLLCGISKIRVEFPVLMLIVAWVGGRRIISSRFLGVAIPCLIVTGILAWVNIRATEAADLFSGGAEQLRGPRFARVVLALSFYFEKYVWPVGLSSYYPTPPYVAWSDTIVWRGIVVVIPVLLFLGWLSLRYPVARVSILWFFASIFSTLPFFPARNVLAADRYMYLPIIGFLWPTACLLLWLHRQFFSQMADWIRRGLIPTAAVIVALSMIGQCWHVAWYYETPIKKTMRVAMLFPEEPRVWERLGWSQYELGHYEEAMAHAEKELHHDVPNVQSGAYQLLGASLLKLGEIERGVENLRRAVEVDPDNGLAKFRLASALHDIGRYAESVPYYEAGVAMAPQHNPTILRLGHVYRRLGRFDDARTMYEQAIENNAYEIPAYLALAEMEMDIGTAEALGRAEAYLTDLLARLPDETAARVSLAAVKQRQGRTREAIEIYSEILQRHPSQATALLNLAQIYLGTAEHDLARSLFDRAAAAGPGTVRQAAAISDYYAEQGEFTQAIQLWRSFIEANPDRWEARGFLTWALALSGDMNTAWQAVRGVRDWSPMERIAVVYISLMNEAYEQADIQTKVVAQNHRTGGEPDRRMLDRLLMTLERFDRVRPGNPWTYCLTAQVLIADQREEGARAFLSLCQEHCRDDECREKVEELTVSIGSLPGQGDAAP
jgi:protein O-mannosyl-transferase